jgi:hypothetical protein
MSHQSRELRRVPSGFEKPPTLVPASYFVLDGDLAGGPLLPPGLPGIFDVS